LEFCRLPVEEYAEIPSTQEALKQHLAGGEAIGGVLAHKQTAGRGRFGRSWISNENSLTISLAFSQWPNHPKPYLAGMQTALKIAKIVDCKVCWPNDLTVRRRKIGGILTDLVTLPDGVQIPVVGIGLNLGPIEFPVELQDRASSLSEQTGKRHLLMPLVAQVLAAIESVPVLTEFSSLADEWAELDDTRGKSYSLPAGTTVIADRVGAGGELLAWQEDRLVRVLAADALFGDVS
jgi:BirA family biotin operon repressor/biotin-[acetyl-CoA-carboxylase] ligase